MRRHDRLERADLAPGLRRPGEGQYLEYDSPVGPPGHRAGHRRLSAEHLGERDPVELHADSAGVDKRVVDIPEDQQARHAVTLSAGQEPGGTPIRQPRPPGGSIRRASSGSAADARIVDDQAVGIEYHAAGKDPAPEWDQSRP